MADDVDPTQPLPTEAEAETIGDSVGSPGPPDPQGFGAPSTTRTFEPVEIAMVEIEIVELEALERPPDTDTDTDTDTAICDDEDVDRRADEHEDVDRQVDEHEVDDHEHEADKAVVELATFDVVISEPVAEPTADVAGPDHEIEQDIDPEIGQHVDPDIEPVEALPSMGDLDRVASELDDIDARLAALDEQRP